MAKNGATLHIEKILADSGHWPVTAYHRVWGGEDSSVLCDRPLKTRPAVCFIKVLGHWHLKFILRM